MVLIPAICILILLTDLLCVCEGKLFMSYVEFPIRLICVCQVDNVLSHSFLAWWMSAFIFMNVLCISSWAHVCMYMQRGKASCCWCSSVSFHRAFWVRVFLPDLRITSLATLVGHWAPGILASLPSQHCNYKHITMPWFLKYNLRLKLRTLCFSAQIIYRLSHFLNLPLFAWTGSNLIYHPPDQS